MHIDYRIQIYLVMQNILSSTLRPKGAQKSPSWHIFPKCWHFVCKRSIYNTKCTLRPKGAQKPFNCWYVGRIYLQYQYINSTDFGSIYAIQIYILQNIYWYWIFPANNWGIYVSRDVLGDERLW